MNIHFGVVNYRQFLPFCLYVTLSLGCLNLTLSIVTIYV